MNRYTPPIKYDEMCHSTEFSVQAARREFDFVLIVCLLFF